MPGYTNHHSAKYTVSLPILNTVRLTGTGLDTEAIVYDLREPDNITLLTYLTHVQSNSSR
jgi:hypothetical protein